MRELFCILVAAVLLAAPRARAGEELDPSIKVAIVVGGVVGLPAVTGMSYLQIRPLIAALYREPTRAELGWSLATSALVAGGFEAMYKAGGQSWSFRKAAVLALPYLALMTWDVWKLAHPIAVAPMISEQEKGIAIAARF